MQEVVIKQEETGPEAPVAPVETPEEPKVETTEVPADETPEEPKEEPKEEPAEEPKEEAEEEKAAKEAAEAAGIDVASVEQHFLEHGEIPADTYEKAAKIGISKEMVDEFVQYRVGQADRVRTEMLQPYGGEDAVVSMIEWAGKNWTAEQADSFNEAINSGNKGRVDLALKALKADFDKQNGVKPTLLKAETSKGVPGGVYETMAQLLKDQADPRYRTDAAFREAVVAKLSRSKI